MKRDWNHLDLTTTFHPMPEDCSRAFMDAVRSVREEKHMKRAIYRTVLIAAAILVCAAAVAVAATQLGWTEYFARQAGITVPQAAQEALESTQPLTYQVGPMTFTFQQMVTDRHMVLSAAHVQRTDGGKAVYADGSSVTEPLDENAVVALDASESGSWLEVAQTAQAPLYGVRALVELDPAYSGESMESALWEEDGTLVYLNMSLLLSESAPDSLPATLYMKVQQYDPVTGETQEVWEDRQGITLEAIPLMEEQTYLPKEEKLLGELQVEHVRGEQYATGTYFTAAFTAPEGMTQEEALDALTGLEICDGDGSPLPDGLNLSLRMNAETLPLLTLEASATLEALPETLLITDGDASVLVR